MTSARKFIQLVKWYFFKGPVIWIVFLIVLKEARKNQRDLKNRAWGFHP